MIPELMEKAGAWAVLRYVSDNPGCTASAVCGGRAHNRTREARLRDLLAEGLFRTEEGVSPKSLSCVRYYLTERGEALAAVLVLLDRV